VRKPSSRNRTRGAALVEFALIVPLLLLLVLGIIEFGVLMMHQLTLVQVAREGSRHASLGRPVAEIEQRITNTAGALPNHEALQIDLSWSSNDGQTYDQTLGDIGAGEENDALPGSLIKVTLGWPHQLITGSFFSWLSDPPADTVPLRAEVVMRRE